MNGIKHIIPFHVCNRFFCGSDGGHIYVYLRYVHGICTVVETVSTEVVDCDRLIKMHQKTFVNKIGIITESCTQNDVLCVFMSRY